MARPLKKGLDYFPLDVNIFEDEKIEPITGEFGIKGEIFVIKLLCAVYQNGYYVVWNERTKMKLLKKLPHFSAELLDQIVNRLIKWEFFDKDLFDSDKVLTSRAIQERYLEATKRRGNNRIEVYVCKNLVNVNNNTSSDSINVDINTQSKVNKIKVNESKEPHTTILENEEGEIVTETPSMVLKKAYPRLLVDKAKNFGLGPDEVENQLKLFDKHHSDNKTAFTDVKHILNSWGKWCENSFKTNQGNFINGKKELSTKAKAPEVKSSSDWI